MHTIIFSGKIYKLFKKDPLMSYKRMTAACGLHCFNRPVFLAKDDEQLRGIISKKTGIPLE